MSGFEYKGSDQSDDIKIRTYSRPATQATIIGIGDPVIINGTADADGTPQAIGLAADTNSKITGIVVGVAPSYSSEDFSTIGLAASTQGDLLVCDDPRALFEIEASATLAITQVGMNAAIKYSATTQSGNIVTVNSTLDNTTNAPATTATFPLQIVKLLEGKTTGTLGDRALVRLNETTVTGGGTGVD